MGPVTRPFTPGTVIVGYSQRLFPKLRRYIEYFDLAAQQFKLKQMIELSPNATILAYAIITGLSTAVFVGSTAHYLVWRRTQVREQARLQKCLAESLKSAVGRKIAA